MEPRSSNASKHESRNPHPEHLQRFSRAAFVELVASRFTVEATPRCFPWTMVLGRRMSVREGAQPHPGERDGVREVGHRVRR
jgi:hypothetical protein